MRIKHPNVYRELEDCYELEIIHKGNSLCTYFDKNVYTIVNKHHWHIIDKGYNKYYVMTNLPRLNGKQNNLYMHRLIMNIEYDGIYEIDHINGNGLDNKNSNLRVVTKIQNYWNQRKPHNNKSTIAGVYFDKFCNKYRVQIGYNNKVLHLGRYKTLAECAFVKMLAENNFFGEYRNMHNDEYLNQLIDTLSNEDKHKLIECTNTRIKQFIIGDK